MKTFLIVISKGIIRRNILDTNFWQELLKQEENIRIILYVEKGEEEYFKENFPEAYGVFGFERESYQGLNKFLMFLVRTGIRSHSTTLYRWRAYKRGQTSLFSTLTKSLISQTLGRMVWCKRFIRALVMRMNVPKDISQIYDEVNPDIVFTPSLIDNDFDVPVAVEARKRGIRVVGMVRSWDNLNNHGLLAFLPDRFIVQNKWLKEATRKFQGISNNEIQDIVGLPHYDIYKDPSRFIKTREEFCSQYGLDPNRKLILLGGSDFYYSEDTLPTTLNNLINSGDIIESTQVIFRPHPASLFTIEDYALDNLEHIVLDPTFVDKKAVKFSDPERFVNLMHHADVVLNIASTLSIDSAVFETPCICINFDDPKKQLSKWELVHRLYDTFDHYEQLVNTGGVRTPASPHQLAEDINLYLEDPQKDSKGRKRILAEFVEPFNGNSGVCLADIIMEEINQLPS